MITMSNGETMKETRKKLTPEQLGLAKLREPFGPQQVSKLPKPTKKQTEEVKADYRKGIRCQICGGWHHKDVIHLDYVGHAALTDRLLDCDPLWNWKPMALDPITNLPAHVKDGLWINLTVCGVTRLGFGDAQGKTGPNAIKEMIGDALRNAAMRFGAALHLWHKGDLHVDDHPENDKPENIQPLDEKKASKVIDAFADPKDTRTPQVKLKLLKEMWQKHYLPRLDQFSKKGKTDVMNTYSGVCDTLKIQGDDNENNK